MIITFFANAEKISPEILKAMSKDKTRGYGELYGAKAKECFYVVDQDGNPVEEARIRGAFWTGGGMNDYVPVDGLTNTNGEYVAEGKSRYKLRYTVSKDGYYSTNGEVVYVNTRSVPAVKDGKWQPYGTKRTIILKQVMNPLNKGRFYGLKDFAVPVFDEWIGFDFEQYAFLPPYGNGVYADAMLRFALYRPSKKEYHMKMEVSFTNQPYAGAYTMIKEQFSELQNVYIANTNADYKSVLVYSYDRFPDKRPIVNKLSKEEYLVFRTRTKVDMDGNLISARYGALYGEWSFVGPRGMNIPFVIFNPKPNDPSIEDSYDRCSCNRKCKVD
jgi:hypothetical protein